MKEVHALERDAADLRKKREAHPGLPLGVGRAGSRELAFWSRLASGEIALR
jgi:hypothetical protein